MERNATIALTPPDKDNVNRLRVPEFGVLKLCLSIGGKSSKSYLPKGVTVPKGVTSPKQDDTATDDFHFAPEKETVKINYRIDDLFGSITKATLELFRRGVEVPVWKKELQQAEYAHSGDKDLELDWNGKIDKSNEFPLEHITVEHSPYKLKLTLEGKGYGYYKTAWTFFHVLINRLQLELGHKEAVAEARDKQLWDSLKDKTDLRDCIPGSGETKEVRLLSNLFLSSLQGLTDNSLFDTYRDKWKDGPNIPIFVKVIIRTSEDKDAEIPKAVGKVKLLWDWKDVEETQKLPLIHFKEVEEFLKCALGRCKATTWPKGDNCHKDHGGKRGDDNKPVFPAQAGYPPSGALTPDTFPFQVEAGSTRTWSAYSYTWASGQLAGQSGVMFQPSRMAGDAYEVHVFFPHHRTWDGKDELDNKNDKMLSHAVSASTGTFQIWREVHIVKYLKKNLTLPTINLVTVQEYYAKAYIRLVNKTNNTIDLMNNYNQEFLNVIINEPLYRIATVAMGQPKLQAIDQNSTKSAIRFVSYAQWENNMNILGLSASTVLGAYNSYENLLMAIADAILPKALNSYLSSNEGITILQFENYWTAGFSNPVVSRLNGKAELGFASVQASVQGGGGKKAAVKAAYIQATADYTNQVNNRMEQTATHEIGHILLLPHASSAAINKIERDLHDEDWLYCTMSYNFNQERKFCGLCLLRLRGWDQTHLDSNRRNNWKP